MICSTLSPPQDQFCDLTLRSYGYVGYILWITIQVYGAELWDAETISFIYIIDPRILSAGPKRGCNNIGVLHVSVQKVHSHSMYHVSLRNVPFVFRPLYYFYSAFDALRSNPECNFSLPQETFCLIINLISNRSGKLRNKSELATL